MQVFEQFPVLKTERLTLRDLRPSDATMIFEIRKHERMNEFIPRKTMSSIREAEALIEEISNGYKNAKNIAWAGVLRDKPGIIGTVGLNHIEPEHLHAEIGGELNPQYWGKNIAFEAFEAVVDFGLNILGLHTIEAKVNPDNRSTIFLLEKLSFKKEAHFQERGFFHGRFQDLAVYSLIAGR